jgi:hypothetical protein
MRLMSCHCITFLDTGATCEEWSTRLIKGELKNDRSVCEGAAFFSDAYAIGKLTVSDGGRGDLEWELLSSITGEVLDSVTIPTAESVAAKRGAKNKIK